jgi:hypothetical protein
MGVAALAEAMNKPTAKMQRWLDELERAGYVTADQANRMMYVRGAVASDGPRTVQTVKAFFADWAELPDCAIKAEIQQDIADVLADAHAELRNTWVDLLKSCGKTYAETGGNTNPSPIPIPIPIPVPSPQPPPSPTPSLSPDPVPEPPPQPSSKRLRPYLNTFERLGAPFDYAAAAARLSDAQKEKLLGIDLRDDLGPALQGLGTSFFASDRARARPTLHDLIVKAPLRQELREGTHEEVGRRWGCAVCGTAHGILEDCPPTCRGCHYRHPAGQYCVRLQSLIRQEREETEREVARRELDEKDRQADAEGFTPDPLGKEAA